MEGTVEELLGVPSRTTRSLQKELNVEHGATHQDLILQIEPALWQVLQNRRLRTLGVQRGPEGPKVSFPEGQRGPEGPKIELLK